ncbi:MAG: GAF and ANTAR domain-containing protein [Mycobacterium sp.]
MNSPANVDETIRAAMVQLIHGHAKDTALEHALFSITSSAVELIEGVDFADMLVMYDGEARSVAPTMPLAGELGTVQLRHQEGPCLDAAIKEALIVSTDMREERRWPLFAPAAVAVGVHGILSYRLIPQHKTTGALNLFSREPHSFDETGKTMGALLATMATVAMMTAVREEQFETALASRDLIGQAKGILMNHYKVDAERAFEMLRTLSQNDNIPLRTIAQKIIDNV